MLHLDDNIFLYYGTKNIDLDIKYEIDPDYNGDNIFEFGNGFYLTPNRELAESYAKYDFLFEKAIPEKRNTIEELIEGTIFMGKLHIYKLDHKYLSENTTTKFFEGLDEYRQVLLQTLEGYNKDNQYRPERDITFGEICGQFWDDYWYIGNPDRGQLSQNELIEKCIEEIEKNQDKKHRQMCVHRKMIGFNKKLNFKQYFIKVGVDEIR